MPEITLKQIERLLDVKLEEKLEQKLDQKLDEKLAPIYGVLSEHSEILKQHSEILEQHSRALGQHSSILDRIVLRLQRIEENKVIDVFRFERLERWAQQVGKKLGIEPEL